MKAGWLVGWSSGYHFRILTPDPESRTLIMKDAQSFTKIEVSREGWPMSLTVNPCYYQHNEETSVEGKGQFNLRFVRICILGIEKVIQWEEEYRAHGNSRRT
jgi:hypothetical protein